MPKVTPKIRCENPCCSKTDFRSIATGSYKVDSIPLPNPATRFIYNGKMCQGMELGEKGEPKSLYSSADTPYSIKNVDPNELDELNGDLLFLCNKCTKKLKICHICNCEKCICKYYY